MKELTLELKIDVTIIEKDGEIIFNDEAAKRKLAARFKEALVADKVDILKCKQFISANELTTEMRLGITTIQECEDDIVDSIVVKNRTAEMQRTLAEHIKQVLAADKIDILKVKHFVMDVEER